MALEITDEFNQPYSERTSGLPSSFSPSVIGIAGVPYLLNTSDGGGYKREAFEVVQQRNTGDTRDTLLLPQDVWRQQVQSWNQGAGQSNADRNDSLLFRYEESFGVDPWYQWHLSLLPETKTMGTYNGDIWLTIQGKEPVYAGKFGVRKAVNEFMLKNELKVYSTTAEPYWKQWYTFKPF